MTAKLDVGDSLREVLQIYREQAGVLLPVAFWLFLVSGIVSGLTSDNLALSPLAFLVGTVVGTLYQGMVVGLVREVKRGGRRPGYGDLLDAALPVLAPLVGAGLLFGVGVGVGFLLLIVPGFVLLTIWAVIAPAIVIERRGVFAAFGRSRELVSGDGWAVFWVVVIAAVIAVVALLLFTAIAGAVADGPIVRIVFGALAATLTAPVEGLVAAVLYYRLVAVKGAAGSPAVGAAEVRDP